MGAALNERARAALEDYEQIDGRIIASKFGTQNTRLNIVNTHCPHAGPQTLEKDQHYNKLDSIMERLNPLK